MKTLSFLFSILIFTVFIFPDNPFLLIYKKSYIVNITAKPSPKCLFLIYVFEFCALQAAQPIFFNFQYVLIICP